MLGLCNVNHTALCFINTSLSFIVKYKDLEVRHIGEVISFTAAMSMKTVIKKERDRKRKDL